MDLSDQTIQDKGGPSNQTPSCARACTNGGYNSPAYLRITSTLDREGGWSVGWACSV